MRLFPMPLAVAREPSQRLGHAQISMTLEVYAHALLDMQRDAVARLGGVLGS